MKKLLILLTTVFICLSQNAYGTTLRFQNELGRKYRIKNVAHQEVYVNGTFYAAYEAMFKNILDIQYVTEDNEGFYVGTFKEYMRNVNINEAFSLEGEYTSEFLRDELGFLTIEGYFAYPSIRSVPTFPSNDVEIGDTWEGTGNEYHSAMFEEGDSLLFSIDVDYELLDIITNVVTNTTNVLAEISIDYEVRHTPYRHETIASYTGYSHTLYYFDIEAGAPHSYSEEFDFLATLKSGETVEFRGYSSAEVEFLDELSETEVENLTELISDEIANDPGVDVCLEDDGILVNLGNVLFDVNKATIKDEFTDSLDDLSDILLEYPDLDIEISGHTDSTGSDDYNAVLSESRAKSVADYLNDLGIADTRISYYGMGSDDPVADNDTSEGRQENRRVEIKILTEE